MESEIISISEDVYHRAYYSFLKKNNILNRIFLKQTFESSIGLEYKNLSRVRHEVFYFETFYNFIVIDKKKFTWAKVTYGI